MLKDLVRNMRKLLIIIALLMLVLVDSPVFLHADQADNEKKSVTTLAPDPKPAWASSWKTETQPVQQTGYSLVLGLGLCFAVLSLGVWAAKKFGLVNQPTRQNAMRIVDRIALSPKTALCIVEAQGKRVLVSVGSERVSFINNLSVDESSDLSGSFEELLCEQPKAASVC